MKPSCARESYGRISGRKLQRIRREHFRRNPLCVMCEAEGRVRLATELDHIVSLGKGGLDVPSNRQGLCFDHHRDKTNADMGYKQRVAIGLDGFPVEEPVE